MRAPEFQYGGDNEKYTEKSYLYGKQLRWAHLELLKQDWSDRRVLELGCFNGFFLDELKKRGADVYGFDVNQDAVTIGSELFALTGRLDFSMERLARYGPFDDILCIDVLEHLDQPGTFINEINELLQPEGRLTVAGPTTERRFYDKSDFPPHHKWRFSRRGLRAMLQQHGFQVVSTSIQYDGMLFLRNFIGRFLYGMNKKEFYGDAVIVAPNMKLGFRWLYTLLSMLGTRMFSILRISYCSTIFVAQKVKHP
jgi:SAM-dependent methyltransferase